MNSINDAPYNDLLSNITPQNTHSPLCEPLFIGDSGELPLEARRILIHLLRGPFLDARRTDKLWAPLITYETLLRSRLAELFLELVIDNESQIAFIRQADTGELEVPQLLRRVNLTLLDSALLIFLRQRLMQADAQGERAVVDNNEMMTELSLYEQQINTDHSGFTKRMQNAINKYKEKRILTALNEEADRWEISPTLKLLFSADEISALLQSYQQLLNSTSPPFNLKEQSNNNLPDN